MDNKYVLILLIALMMPIGSTYCKPQTHGDHKMEPRISVITLGISNLERSYHFYKKLGLPTEMTPDAGIVVFMTSGTRLSLYPYEKLAEDVGIDLEGNAEDRPEFIGITLAHTVREKQAVDALLQQARDAGGKIVKNAQDVFWGGYSGYFADPDGYLWEVNYSDAFRFEADGSISFQ